MISSQVKKTGNRIKEKEKEKKVSKRENQDSLTEKTKTPRGAESSIVKQNDFHTETDLQEWVSVHRMEYRSALRRRKEEWTRKLQKTEEKIRDLIILLQLFKKNIEN